jgi:hypothetical protein
LPIPKSRKIFKSISNNLTLKFVFLNTSEPENSEGANQDMLRSEAIMKAGIHSLFFVLSKSPALLGLLPCMLFGQKIVMPVSHYS